MLEVVVDGRACHVPEGMSILEAARSVGVRIPTLCHHPWLERRASCGVCVVEVAGKGELVTACDHAVEAGMVVQTTTGQVMERRREIVSFLLAQHPRECLVCERKVYCELKKLGDDLGVRARRLPIKRQKLSVDRTGRAITRDPNKCVMCGRCVAACKRMHEMTPYQALSNELARSDRLVSQGGAGAVVSEEWAACRSLAFEDRVCGTDCVECGQCVQACPTGALSEKSDLVKVRRSLAHRGLVTVAQTAPAMRATLAEAWGMPAGTVSTGRMVAALRKLGFDRVFDTAFGADLTAVEEAHELKGRIEKGGRLPMFTSCCPAWVRFVENEYPGLVPHLSTCKSPHMMAGAVARAMLSELEGVNPEAVYVVSMMPCTAKKFEAQERVRPYAGGSLGGAQESRDVDAVLTTRELIRLIQSVEMDFESLEESNFDAPLGDASGAGTIFGTTGGVMEAALRALADELGADVDVVTDGDHVDESLAVAAAPGPAATRAEVRISYVTLRVAVVQGLAGARRILDQVASGGRPYDFVEVMACPGGCVGGGGQPIVREGLEQSIGTRGAALCGIDRSLRKRRPRENPAVAEVYRRFLGEVGGLRARELLHDRTRLEAQGGAR
ncbi:MAG: [FeFe] hydrogenase, group A [Bacillota bacterium]